MVTSDVLKTFGEKVRAARSAAGWTLAQLAEEAFRNPDRKGYISQIEHGRKPITALTVGKLAEALDLPESVTAPMYANDAPTEETFDATDQRAETLLTTAEREGAGGVAEALMIGLAYDYAEGDAVDLDTAYRGLRAALETAREMKERAALPDNTDAGISAVRAEVQRLNEGDEREAAREAIAEAMAKKTAEMSALLDLGVQQDRILNDPAAAAERLVEKARLEGIGFAAFRALQELWHEQGKRAGVRFDLLVAIHIAEAASEIAPSPHERGAALNDHGTSLQTLGERESLADTLEKAVNAYGDALKEITRAGSPRAWAITQNNLGTALATLGERESGTMRLKQAVNAYGGALLERKRGKEPLEWAMTQNNLGNALACMGERESGTRSLEEAVVAYKGALEEYNRERFPLEWAMTQSNLGNALKVLGEREASETRLEQAVTLYRIALEERTRERVPYDWAATQNNLGNALVALAEHSSGTNSLLEAETAFHNALQEWTRDQAPMYWALTQLNLTEAKIALFDKTLKQVSLDEAYNHIVAANEVLQAGGTTHYSAAANGLTEKIAKRRAERKILGSASAAEEINRSD